MKIKSNFILIIVLIVTFNSCIDENQSITRNKKSKEKFNSSKNLNSKNDTLKCLNCLNITETRNYYNVFNQIAIPSCLILKDSTSIFIRNEKHCFVVLEPKDLINTQLDFDSKKKRILIHSKIVNHKAEIVEQYDNIITNSSGVSSQFNSIRNEKNRLIINHEFGNRYYWNYQMFLEIDEKIKLKKIKVECFNPNGNSKSYTYYYKNIKLNSINIDDTMNINCGCDKFWKY